MKKSKNERKKKFLQRIEHKQDVEKIEEKVMEPEAPSEIAMRYLLKHTRGHIGKTYDDELER